MARNNGKAAKVRRAPAQSFYEATRDGQTVYVKRGYDLEACTGEAHSNPNIDHCMLCLGVLWGWRVVPGK